jgi:hypothetical protein
MPCRPRWRPRGITDLNARGVAVGRRPPSGTIAANICVAGNLQEQSLFLSNECKQLLYHPPSSETTTHSLA